MSTSICQNFVQNTWKKELCSNCFKSKDEHNLNITKKPIQFNSNKKVASIIKSKSKTTKLSVSFTSETKIIGFGGEEWPDGNEEFDESEVDYDHEEIDSEPDDDHFKELQKLTKSNTEFNSVNANLANDNLEVKKSYTHLKLGTPQIDADGRKQTLLVSVTPFGQPELIKKSSKTTSFIPVAKNHPSNKNEEKSLLEEITETLEKGKTPIQIITRKRPLQHDDKNKEATYLLEKAVEKSAEKIKDLKLNKTNIPERKNGLTRATVIKRDQEKPVVFQTSTAKIELLNNKNLILNETLNKTEETESDKIDEKPEENSNNISDTNDNDFSEESGNSSTETLNEAQESRQQAGEPDGQADAEPSNVTSELLALPTTPPPPIETCSSFLQGLDKPKLPVKPSTVLVRKPLPVMDNQTLTQTPPQILTTFAVVAKIPDDPKLTINGKCKTPKPPLLLDHELKQHHDFIQQRQERAVFCSPELRPIITPEPTPRLSLSTDSLCDIKSDDKKKEKLKRRFCI